MYYYYLCGPMSGIPQFNFPLFEGAAYQLRKLGFAIVSPAEMDTPEIYAQAMASPDGAPLPGDRSWGDFLARDIKIVADEVQGLILLPGWESSRGARLEVFTGLLTGKRFMLCLPDEEKTAVAITSDSVRVCLMRNMP